MIWHSYIKLSIQIIHPGIIGHTTKISLSSTVPPHLNLPDHSYDYPPPIHIGRSKRSIYMSSHEYPELVVQRIHYESLHMHPKMRHANPSQTSFHKRKYTTEVVYCIVARPVLYPAQLSAVYGYI
jgi:hypothetical protein